MARKYIQNCTGADCLPAQKKHTNDKIARVTFYALAVLFVCAFLYVLFFSGQMQISSITITGTQQLSSQGIATEVQQSLQGKYLKIIPKNNFLFVSQDSIKSNIENSYKKVRDVSVQKKFPDSITINIDERQALLVWCQSDQSCFLLDENGIAYSTADFSSPELVQNQLLRVDDSSAETVSIGEKVIDPQYENYVLGINAALGNMGITASEEYSTPSRMSQEIDVKSQSGYELNFSTQFSVDSAMNTLSLILKKGISQDQLSNLAYIDLRSENKAFYKLNNTDPQQADTTSAQPVDDSSQKSSDSSKKK